MLLSGFSTPRTSFAGLLLSIALLFAIQLCLVSVPTNGQPLFEDLWTISSVNGELNVFLVDELANVTVNGQTVELRVWNKSFTGPMLRAKRGDTINLYLLNKLDQETNIHFHGFHVSPQAPADETYFMLGNNGDIKLYQFTIPDFHPQGMFWYHSHATFSEYQIFSGMSGIFVVEGLLDSFPNLATVKEKTILLRDIQIINGSVPAVDELVGEADTTRLVNGNIFPDLHCPIDETQLWNIANIGADIPYLLNWKHPDGSPATEISIWLVAMDGVIRGDKEVFDPTGKPFILGPANRAQFLIRCPSEVVDIKLVTNLSTNGFDDFPETDLVNIIVTGTAANDIQNLTMTTNQFDYRTAEITAERRIEFSEPVGGDDDDGAFFINQKTYREGRVDIRTFLGAIERWTIINLSGEVHYFHIHQGHFQIESVDGVPQPFNGYVDTAFLDYPREENGFKSNITVIIPFTDAYQVGKIPFHCHIEAHANGGMMLTLQLVASPDVDVVFVAISIPVLAIIFVVSVGYLGYQWRHETKSLQAATVTTDKA